MTIGDQGTKQDLLFGDVCRMTVVVTIAVTITLNEVTISDHSSDQNSSFGVGYFSNGRGFSVESTLQDILSNLFSWKRNDSSVVLQT